MTVRLIGRAEFRSRLGNVSQSTFDRLIDKGVIPPAIYLGLRSPRWPDEVADQVINRIASGGVVSADDARALNRDIPRPGRPRKVYAGQAVEVAI